MKKILRLVLLTSFLLPMQMQSQQPAATVVQDDCCNRSNNCCSRKFNSLCVGALRACSISAQRLFLDGVPLNNLVGLAGAIGAAGAAGTAGIGTGVLGELVSSIIPFASGVITIGTTVPDPFPAEGYAMAFGAGSVLNVGAATLANRQTSFAFTVPAAGTLHDLQVSVDSVYTALGAATPFTFTFTLFVSPCVQGGTPAYTATALSADATTTPPAGAPLVILAPGGTGCGASGLSIPVAQGDRIVLVVTPNAPVPLTTITNLAFSAGVMYSPA